MIETPGKMYALSTVLTLLAAVAVLVRLHARKIKNAVLAWDDYLILFALVGLPPRVVPFPSDDGRADKIRSSYSRLVLHCVCSLVGIRLRGSLGAGLIASDRNRTWGSGTTHKDRTGWLTGLYPSFRGLPTGKTLRFSCSR